MLRSRIIDPCPCHFPTHCATSALLLGSCLWFASAERQSENALLRHSQMSVPDMEHLCLKSASRAASYDVLLISYCRCHLVSFPCQLKQDVGIRSTIESCKSNFFIYSSSLFMPFMPSELLPSVAMAAVKVVRALRSFKDITNPRKADLLVSKRWSSWNTDYKKEVQRQLSYAEYLWGEELKFLS